MEGIANQYGHEKAILMAVEAGVDLLYFSNTRSFDPHLVEKVIGIVAKYVEEGRLPEERIDSSYKRIQKLKTNRLII